MSQVLFVVTALLYMSVLQHKFIIKTTFSRSTDSFRYLGCQGNTHVSLCLRSLLDLWFGAKILPKTYYWATKVNHPEPHCIIFR